MEFNILEKFNVLQLNLIFTLTSTDKQIQSVSKRQGLCYKSGSELPKIFMIFIKFDMKNMENM